MTASEEHEPERRLDERRQIAQPAYYGEHRTAIRRTADVAQLEGQVEGQVDGQEPAEPSLPGAVPRQDYEFLTGLIHMQHTS